MSRFRMPAFLGLLAASALLVACAGGGNGTPQPTAAPGTPAGGGGATVAVSLGDFHVTAAPGSVPAGAVRFEVKNEGSIPHELTVIRTDAEPNALPTAGGMADVSGLEVAGDTGEVAAGQSKTLETTLTAGRYLLICNVAGHYPAGMTTAFTVE
jgi:uncharacterized cupredoxin-like copper-binding protein